MKRRSAIRDLLVAGGGAVALPFWMQACRSGAKGVGTMTMVADTIVPGASELGVDHYVERMVADCYEQPVKENVRKQLAALEGRGFVSASRGEREALLMQLAGSANKEEQDFFLLIKNETIRGYTTSRKVMEEYFHYTVAPGHYFGCVLIKS